MWGVAWKGYCWLFGPEDSGRPGHLWPRWLWLRALGLIFFSAFYSWFFQVRGLIGPNGLLPAGEYLQQAAEQFGAKRFWMVPTLLWFDSSDRALIVLCIIGLSASVLLVLNVWPRGMMAICIVVFLSFICAAQDFASYQSDGMLLAAGFLSLFFAPAGLRPRLGQKTPPSRASLFLLQWLWFQIYFESGVVKWAGGDPEWRHLTALDHYYENGPLPDWIGWYAQQLPHVFQATVAAATLLVEIFVVWMLFLPRKYRRICFCIVTPFQIGIILTANLAFLNYFTLAMGFLLLDDEVLTRVYRRLGWAAKTPSPPAPLPHGGEGSEEVNRLRPNPRPLGGRGCPAGAGRVRGFLGLAALAIHGFFLTWIFYNTAAQIFLMFLPILPLPASPIETLEPFRISERYGLFAAMTTARYEIEFQGSRDGVNWIAYPFRYKPQDPHEAPKLYAPYQPRFDWDLWFASLGGWRDYPFVLSTEVHLLKNTSQVLALFAGNPFGNDPPREVRAVEWQYWFTDLATKRKEGLWWHRKFIGLYAPTLECEPDGKINMIESPEAAGGP
jgi:lipase maturation factor 1